MPGPIAAAVAPTASAPRGDDPGGEPAPAAVQHRHAAGPGEGDRQAVGGEDQRRQPGLGDDVAVDLGDLGCPGSANGLGCCGSAWKASSAPWTWSPIGIRAGSSPSAAASRRAVLDHRLVPVVGEDAEVEPSKGASLTPPTRVAKAARAPPRSASQPPHPVSLAPLHRR